MLRSSRTRRMSVNVGGRFFPAASTILQPLSITASSTSQSAAMSTFGIFRYAEMCALPRPLKPITATLTVLFWLGSALALSATGNAIDDMRKCLRLTLFIVSPSLPPRSHSTDQSIAEQTLGDEGVLVKLVD